MCLDLCVNYMSCWIGVRLGCPGFVEQRTCAEVGGVPEREAEVFSERIYGLYGLIRLRIKTLLVTVLNLYEMQVTRYLC